MKPRLTDIDFTAAAASLGVEAAVIYAVCQVEAPRGGFNPDDTPTTLFEGHWFHKLTKGVYDAGYPDISYYPWTKAHYGHTWQAEQERLHMAMKLDQEAALMSASWGKFQLMGFHFDDCGFPTVDEFVTYISQSEHAQLAAFAAFVRQQDLLPVLRRNDWSAFASVYNGPDYRDNNYDRRLADAYAKGVIEKDLS